MSAAATSLLAILLLAPLPLACVPALPRALLACVLLTFVGIFAAGAARGRIAVRVPAGAGWLALFVLLAVLQCVPLIARELPGVFAGLVQAPVATASLLPWRTLVRALEAALLLAVLVAAATLFSDRRRARRCVGLLLGLASALSIYGILARFGAVPLLDPEQPRDVVAGTYVNRNHFAGLLELALLAGLGLLVGQHRRSREAGRLLPEQMWTLAGLIVCTAALVLSESRGGIACLGLGGLVFACLAGRQDLRRWLLPAGAVTLVAGAVVLWLAPPTFLARLHTVGNDLSFTGGRPAIWAATLRLWGLLPWSGVGLGVFGEVSALTQLPGVGGRFDHAHSDWLEFLCETGPLGLGLIAAALWSFVAGTGRHAAGRPLAAGAAAGVVAMALHGLVDFNLQIPANALWCAALAGLAWARVQEEPMPVAISPRPRLVAAAVAVASVAALLPLGAQGAAEVHIARAAVTKGNAAVALLAQSDRIWPGTGEAAERAGWVLVRGDRARERAAEVAEWAGKALHGNPFAPTAWELLGRARLLEGDLEAAEAAFDRSLLCLNPDDRPRVALHLALLVLDAGHVGRAVARVRAALEADESLLETALSRLYGSVPAWELVGAAVPATPDAHRRAAGFLLQRGDYAAREQELARAAQAKGPADGVTLEHGWRLDRVAARQERRHGREVLIVALHTQAGTGPAPHVVARLTGQDVVTRDGLTLSGGHTEIAVPFMAPLPPGPYQLGLEIKDDVPPLPLGHFERADQVLVLDPSRVLRAEADFYVSGDKSLWRRVQIPARAEALAVSVAGGSAETLAVELDGQRLPNESARGLATGRFVLLGMSGERLLRIRPASPDHGVVDKVSVLERDEHE